MASEAPLKLTWSLDPGDTFTWNVALDSFPANAPADYPSTVVLVMGPPGPSGAEASRYTHTQTVPEASWVINHNLGVFPSVVTVKSPGGIEVVADVQHISVNQCIVSFGFPYTGVAIIS